MTTRVLVNATFAGTNPHAVYRLQLDQLGTDHTIGLAQLPEVGPHADELGNVIANLGLPVELRSYGWQLQHGHRITAREQRRATAHRDSMIQALADVAQGQKVQTVAIRLPGPVATSIALMAPSGQRVLRDPGARTELAAAWTAGLATLSQRVADVVGASLTVIVDEPQVAQAVNGTIRSVSGADVERALDRDDVAAMWRTDDLAATVLFDTGLAADHPMVTTAAQSGGLIMEWPTGRSAATETAWQHIDALVAAQTPVGLVLTGRREPKHSAEALLGQWTDWGLEPAGLQHTFLTKRLDRLPELQLGAELGWLRTVVDHANDVVHTI